MIGKAEIVASRWSWLRVESSGPDKDGWWTLKAEPKRWYALYPSFWLMAFRSRSLMPTAADLEIEEQYEVEDR